MGTDLKGVCVMDLSTETELLSRWGEAVDSGRCFQEVWAAALAVCCFDP